MWAGDGGCGCSWVVTRRFGGVGDARHVGRWRRRLGRRRSVVRVVCAQNIGLPGLAAKVEEMRT